MITIDSNIMSHRVLQELLRFTYTNQMSKEHIVELFRAAEYLCFQDLVECILEYLYNELTAEKRNDKIVIASLKIALYIFKRFDIDRLHDDRKTHSVLPGATSYRFLSGLHQKLAIEWDHLWSNKMFWKLMSEINVIESTSSYKLDEPSSLQQYLNSRGHLKFQKLVKTGNYFLIYHLLKILRQASSMHFSCKAFEASKRLEQVRGQIPENILQYFDLTLDIIQDFSRIVSLMQSKYLQLQEIPNGLFDEIQRYFSYDGIDVGQLAETLETFTLKDREDIVDALKICKRYLDSGVIETETVNRARASTSGLKKELKSTMKKATRPSPSNSRPSNASSPKPPTNPQQNNKEEYVWVLGPETRPGSGIRTRIKVLKELAQYYDTP